MEKPMGGCKNVYVMNVLVSGAEVVCLLSLRHERALHIFWCSEQSSL